MKTQRNHAQRISVTHRGAWMGVLLALASNPLASGCRGSWGWGRPKGNMNQQQADAVIHDPFPQNDIGPFEAASRPPDYQQPLPEPVRDTIGRQYRGRF